MKMSIIGLANILVAEILMTVKNKHPLIYKF